MENITPQDLDSVLALLDFIKSWATEKGNTEAYSMAEELEVQYSDVFVEKDSDKLKLPYNRKDYYSILEYLKLQAEQLSKGKWNDFTDNDIGTIFLKLMSYLSDMNNYQVDKSIAELYLSTCTERASALLLCRLIGYEPRHYTSAEVDLVLGVTTNDDGEVQDVPDGTLVPRGSVFNTSDGTKSYVSLEDTYYYDNLAKVTVYEGTLVSLTYSLENVDTLGRIVLPNYTMAFNTVQLNINSEDYLRVDNVAINTGDLAFSVHCNEDKIMYMQLPVFWSDLVTSSSYINISYCLSAGEDGRVGKNKVNAVSSINSDYKSRMTVVSSGASIEGFNPETISEIKISAPIRARTMDTIVTIKDFEEVGSLVNDIADVRALDYNDPSSGLVQPTVAEGGGYVNDAYKVNIYVLPETTDYDEEDEENNKYRNTIIKDRDDWEYSDMGKVADSVEHFSKLSISGSQITLEDMDFDLDNVILGINTSKEYTSYLAKYINTIPVNSDTFEYTMTKSGTTIIITMSPNWRTYLTDDITKLSVFFKSDQILTTAGQELRESIDEKRLASLFILYYDMGIIQPTINVEVYMDSRNVNYETIESNVKSFILERYSRKYLKSGDPIFASVIGASILDNYDFIRYVEVGLPTFTDDKVEALPREFIDIIPPNVTVTAFDYQNKVI